MSDTAHRPASLDDPTHYPVEEKVGEDIVHRWIVELLRPLVERWLQQRGERALVGADQFIYWVQYAPTSSVAPDVYVLPGVAPDTPITCWKVWETGIVPSFALEVASGDRREDYEAKPRRYAELGVGELIVYDPRWDGSAERIRWQVFRRRRDGELLRVEAADGDRVRSEVLGCWLREVGEGAARRLRIGTDPRGDALLPTAEEAEREGRERAEAEVERLRAELRALRGEE